MMFEVVSWILFGATLGGLAAFFMEKRGFTIQFIVAGVLGGVAGGVLGMLVEVALPDVRWASGGYSFTRLLFAMVMSIVAIAIDRKTLRRGKKLVQDPRPDVP